MVDNGSVVSAPRLGREWNVEQHWLLPPSVMDFVPADHIAHFIRDTACEQLDLSAILAARDSCPV